MTRLRIKWCARGTGRRRLAMVLNVLLLSSGAVAEPTPPDTGGPSFPTATNLEQLRQLALNQRRALCSFRLAGVVRSANAAMDRVVLQDETSAELLELDLQGRQLAPGDRVELEAQACSVAAGPAGLVLGRSPVVDNDGIHPLLRRRGAVYLEPGRHAVRLLWFNARGRYGLTVGYEGPGLTPRRIPDTALFQSAADPVSGLTNPVHGLTYRCYEGAWLSLAAGFGRGPAVEAGLATNFDLGVRSRNEQVGLEFSGYLEVPRAGLYTFTTESDDGSQLFIAEPAPHLERLGTAALAAPRRLVVAQVLAPDEENLWTEVEGTVTFASETGTGLEVELRGDTGRMTLRVADGSGLSPPLLLQRRVRAVGLSRGIHSLEGPQVLGLLSVPSGADLTVVESAPGGTASLPLLSTAEQVKGLKREEAQRGYPVRLRGVITRAVRGYDSVVVQDATRGVYVGGVPARDPEAPQFGEYWEIEGVTAPGDFAPVVAWRRGRRLGAGRLPEPVAATWDQLMSGSLDTQYVELQGIVTAVARNRLELLLREGKIKLGFLDREPDTLSRFENARIRVRGCLFPAWNRATHQVNLGAVNIASASLCLEEPAPADLFSLPAKSGAELLLFDPTAGALQRVKVAGQLLCARQGLAYLSDGTNGVRFQPPPDQHLEAGDLVEVVGFPELGGPSPLLHEAVVRRTGHAELPPPRVLGPDGWLDGTLDSTRGRLEGYLVQERSEQSEEVLEMHTGLRNYVARLGTRTPGAAALAPGSRLELTGIYAAQGANRGPAGAVDSFELLLGSAADIRVLARPPWLTLPRVRVALGALGFVLLAAMLWALSLRRRVSAQTAIIRHKAQREAALEERTRIARDIHDDLGSNLTFIMMLGERSREDLGKPRELASHTDKIVAYARATVQALDEIVWAINPQNDTLDALVGYLSQYATHCFESTNVRCRLNVPERLSSLALPAEIRHDLFLVVKEALNNVLKHAQASEVDVAVSELAGVLEIGVEDRGRGFDAGQDARNGHGDGLKNMHKRMAKIGGRFSLASVPGQGTKIRLTVRLTATGRGA